MPICVLLSKDRSACPLYTVLFPYFSPFGSEFQLPPTLFTLRSLPILDFESAARDSKIRFNLQNAQFQPREPSKILWGRICDRKCDKHDPFCTPIELHSNAFLKFSQSIGSNWQKFSTCRRIFRKLYVRKTDKCAYVSSIAPFDKLCRKILRGRISLSDFPPKIFLPSTKTPLFDCLQKRIKVNKVSKYFLIFFDKRIIIFSKKVFFPFPCLNIIRYKTYSY